MTDEETIDWVCTLFEIRPSDWITIHRNGRILLALPRGRRGALRALRLYQPQRIIARTTMAALGLAVNLGLHNWFLPRLRHQGGIVALEPDFQRANPGTCGILLGSPEHRVRRAIVSYQNAGKWEVAKVAFGKEGAEVLEHEAEALKELSLQAKGVPALLGLHRGEGVTLLRMSYLSGQPILKGESVNALNLLESWITNNDPKPSDQFPEWAAIESALSGSAAGGWAIAALAQQVLIPVICHGDFARWNLLKQNDDSLIVLDWEWGHSGGLPRIDLVHYFLQDERLVKRLPPAEAIHQTIAKLRSPACSKYLARTGWSGEPLLPIIASLAYKQGAGHQENRDVLNIALEMSS
jgi:hypothetical protein